MANNKNKGGRISSRIDDALRSRLDAIHARYGSTDSAVLDQILPAWCEHVFREGKVQYPVRVDYDEAAARLLHVADEAPKKVTKK